MIAYNHYIKFIPEFKNDKKVKSTFIDTITVKENISTTLEDKLLNKLTFANNQGRDISLYSDIEFAHTEEGQFWAFEVKDIMTLFWYSGRLELEYTKHENFTESLLEYWCLHIVLPLFFTIEETYHFLHAGAVEIEGSPILFAAHSMGGKSTMTDFFIKQGHTMVSDDKVGIENRNDSFYVVPSHPHQRPYRAKEDLGFFIENIAANPKLVNSIYELEQANKDDEVKITELKGIDKFKSLRYASEINLYFLKPKRLEFLLKLAKKVKVYQVCVPWDLDRQHEVYNTICEHVKVSTHFQLKDTK